MPDSARVDAVVDLSTGTGIEIRGTGASSEQLEACFKETHDWY